VPPPDASGFRNEPIRQAVLARLNASPGYRTLFGEVFPEVAGGAPIDFSMFGRAVAEFEFTITFADTPLDRFARGEDGGMTAAQKKGGVLFFGKGGCVSCNAVAGATNEMFSGFRMHRIGVPQLAPAFGVRTGNVVFDGPREDEDFGLEQITGDPADRYAFRTSPLRNVALQPAFFHDGAFTRLRDAVAQYADAAASALRCDPRVAGVDRDLRRLGPVEPLLDRLDPLLPTGKLSHEEIELLVIFLRDALLDPRATLRNLCALVPAALRSGMMPLIFEGCR
jgi:cytochrome c peroxidase